MNEINEEVVYLVDRVFGVCVEWLGLQRSASNILAALYISRKNSANSLSMDELCTISNLSHSTVSSICSQLEALDLVERQLEKTLPTRGRRRIVFSLRVGIDDMLKSGILRNINILRRILDDLRFLKDNITPENTETEIHIRRLTDEICYFLENPLQNGDSQICISKSRIVENSNNVE